jgi:hypothetical protein
MTGFAFIIFGQTAIAAKPSEGAFDDPALGEDLEAGEGAFDDLEVEAATGNHGVCPRQELSGIAAVSEDPAHPAEVEQSGEQKLGSITVLQSGAVHNHRKDQSQGVDQKVSFSSVDLLASVIATFSGLLSHLDALTVDNRSSRGFFFRSPSAPDPAAHD